MINWNAVPASYNEAWTYLEMLGKLVSVVNRHDSDIEILKSDVSTMKIQITQIIAAISDIRDMVGDLAGDVNNLENRVETLEAEIDDIGNIVEVGQCGENVYYALYSDGRLLIKGTGDMYDWENGHSPFYANNDIKNIIISTGVTSVGDEAFWKCENVESVSLPNGLTRIGDLSFVASDTYAAHYGKLKEITIPNSVTEIGGGSFWSAALESVFIPVNVSTVGSFAFRFCDNMETVRYAGSKVGAGMFSGCYKLRDVTLSTNVTEIGENAFSHCTQNGNVNNGIETITYTGTLAMWEEITKGTNWDGKVRNTSYENGTTPTLKRIQCSDGAMVFDETAWEWVVETTE